MHRLAWSLTRIDCAAWVIRQPMHVMHDHYRILQTRLCIDGVHCGVFPVSFLRRKFARAYLVQGMVCCIMTCVCLEPSGCLICMFFFRLFNITCDAATSSLVVLDVQIAPISSPLQVNWLSHSSCITEHPDLPLVFVSVIRSSAAFIIIASSRMDCRAPSAR